MSTKAEIDEIEKQLVKIRKIKQVKDAVYHKTGIVKCALDYGHELDSYTMKPYGKNRRTTDNTRDMHDGIIVTFHPILIRQSIKDTKARLAKVWRTTGCDVMYWYPLERSDWIENPWLIGGGHMHMGCFGGWDIYIRAAMRKKDYVHVTEMLILYMQFGRQAGYPTEQYERASTEQVKQYFAR